MKLRELAAWALVLLLALAAFGGVVLAVSGSAVDRITVRYADGSVQDFVPEAPPVTLTPSPTATLQVTASATPTMPATNTPRPTFTASPTPVPSSATPTQEIVTWTPVPTTTPASKCTVKNNDNAATYLRAAASTNAPRVGLVLRGATQELLAVQDGTQGHGYLWARTFVNGVGGWFVIRQHSSWWVYSLGSETDACVDLDGWPSGELPPPINPNPPTPTATPRPPQTRAALLFHAVPGANSWEMQQAWQVLRSKGIAFGVKSINETELCRSAISAGGICIFRSVHPSDCPDTSNADPRREAYLYMLSVAPYYNQNITPTYLELVNECNMDNLAWWNEFMLEAVRLQQAWSWRPLAMPSLIPGAGDSALIAPLVPALRALRDAGGCFSSHDYGIYNSHLIAQDGTCDVWTSCRHELIRAALDRYGLQDLPICITEAARGGGGLPVDEGDFIAWYRYISNDAGLHSVSLWTAGATGSWPDANLNGHMVQIAQGVQ